MLEFIQSPSGLVTIFLISFGIGAIAGYYVAFRLKNEQIELKNDELKLLRKELALKEKRIAQMEINAEATMILRRCLDSRLS